MAAAFSRNFAKPALLFIFEPVYGGMNMVFNQNEIGREPLLFEVSKNASWLTNIRGMAGGKGEIRLSSPIVFKAGIERIGDRLRVSGEVSLKVASRCSRCLDDADKNITHRIESVITMPQGGGDIDISDDMREHVAMSMPSRIICDSDCKGLCASCGANLNKRMCDCAIEREESKFSVALNKARAS